MYRLRNNFFTGTCFAGHRNIDVGAGCFFQQRKYLEYGWAVTFNGFIKVILLAQLFFKVFHLFYKRLVLFDTDYRVPKQLLGIIIFDEIIRSSFFEQLYRSAYIFLAADNNNRDIGVKLFYFF